MTPLPPATRWHLYPDAAALAARAAAIVERAAREAIAARGRFRLVLAGGATPQAVYAHLARARADWPAWEIYFGDERCLPPADPQRNSETAWAMWLGQGAAGAARVHVIPAELGPQAAAAAYEPVVAAALPFDLVLLGLGEDGHTASLFPGRAYPSRFVIPVHDAPKAPAERVSLNRQALSQARQVLFLVTGAAKRAAVRAWLRGEPLPAAQIRAAQGADVLLDASAWPGD